MSDLDYRLINAYQNMADLTRPRCREDICRVKAVNRCCDEMFCSMADQHAEQEWGIILEPTGHPRIPFMGPEGCVVPPHLRPICTVHDCQINAFGAAADPEFTERYFNLLEEIARMEYEREQLRKNGSVR